MTPAGLRQLSVALGFGLAGAAAATLAGVPAAALLGSTVAVTGAALLRLAPAVPNALRNGAFLVIGVTLGAGVTPQFLSDVARWPLSLAMLAATIIAVMAFSGWILRRFFGIDSRTAVLATSPGALSYTLSLAASGAGDVRSVMVLQSLRLLIITVLLPPMIGFVGDNPATWSSQHAPEVGYLTGIILLAAGFAVGMTGERIQLPAAHLLSGLIVSATAHAAGFVEGRLPLSLTFLGFTITGAVIGARFAGLSRQELARLGGAGVIAASGAVALSAAVSAAAAWLTGLPFGQIWVSFAPGGVEAMSSMALALGYDPVFVATHHVFRIVLLIAVLPLLLRLVSRI